MKKPIKIVLISIISVFLILVGIQFWAMLLMQDEDFHIDIEHLTPNLQDGDLIFQTSKSSQSKAIQLATRSKYSHMGMVYKENGKTFVFEAVQPVKFTPIEEWVNRGNKGYYIVKRLQNSDKILTPAIISKMKGLGNQYIGKDYDLSFDWSDQKMYCSELVWKIYKKGANVEIGHLQKLKDLNLSNKIVKQKLIERYGDNIPLDEVVITPVSMLNSKSLITIYEE